MLEVTFYGVRGSTPVCCDGTRGFGGNTSCVLVRIPGNAPIVLDCGTGMRYLGHDLGKSDEPFRGVVLLTHLHWDHVQGLPFFTPMLREGAEMLLIGPELTDTTLLGELESFVRPPLFPVRLSELPGTYNVHEQSSGMVDLGEVTVSICRVPHSGLTNGYRIDTPTGSVAYLPDHQQPGISSTHVDAEVLALCRDVDLLIHDAQYSDTEFDLKSDWGHSTPSYALEVARQAGARRLVMFHHDPTHDDAWIEEAARATRRSSGAIEVIAAKEGLRIVSGA